MTSPATITASACGNGLEEYRRWCDRDLSGADYVYCWADGLHFGVRLDADRVCTLVVIGVRDRQVYVVAGRCHARARRRSKVGWRRRGAGRARRAWVARCRWAAARSRS